MISHLSLFSGIGGLDLAAEMAGMVTVGQCEWADYPTRVLERHWPTVPRWRDIRTLTGESFYERTGLRTVDVVSGGFPCQPFSVAGKRRGEEDDRYLWPEMLRVIRELRPRWVVGENVAGIVNMALDKVLSDLEEEGYTGGAMLIPACGVDAPHRRERCAILAYRDELRRDVRRTEGAGVHRDKARNEDWPGRPDFPDAARELLDRGELGSTQAGRAGPANICGYVPDAALVGRETDGAAGERERGARLETTPAARRCALSDADDGAALRRKSCGGAAERDGGGGTDNAGGAAEYAGRERRTVEPRLGGMADGVSDWLELGMSVPGCWLPEPPGIPRITENKENRAARLKCLGNAVVPQQFYPVFRGIVLLESHRRD